MNQSFLNLDDKRDCVGIVLDQTSKESIIECAHDSGGLIGWCASSRENCECGLYFIIKEPSTWGEQLGN